MIGPVSDQAMSAIALLLALFFLWAGAYALTRSSEGPETPSGGWMSTPARRRVGGGIALAWACALIVLAFALGR
jgi:hypothetical protein